MANDVTANPLIIDAAGVLVVTSLIKIQKIRLTGAVVDKTITLKDRTGKVRWKSIIGAGATPTEPPIPPDSDFNPPLQIDGLTVEDISSAGTLYIYLADTGTPVKTA